jgi:micrococcal nuclease
MKKLFIFLLIWSSFQAVSQTEMTAKVTAVIDGNTFEITGADNQPIRVVLAGVDSPEPGQEFSEKARKLMEKMLLEEEVSVSIKGKDRWGNYVAIVMKGNTDPRIELLEEGLAWTAEKNPLPEFEEIRVRAQEKGKGLWKEANPIPPWTFRRQQSMMQAKG